MATDRFVPTLDARNLGRRVALADDPAAVGEVTIDLRREHLQPPWCHVLLYVRFEPGGPRLFGTWARPDQLIEAAP